MAISQASTRTTPARNGARSRCISGAAPTTWRRPAAKSLRDTAARVLPYYIQEILPRVLRGERVLVSAHGNSLRALVMVLDKHTTASITKLNIATGVPMIYRLNANSTVASKLDLAA